MSDAALRERLNGLSDEVLRGLLGKSMLLSQDWSRPEIDAALAVAEAFHRLDGKRSVPALFPDQLNWALFFDASTRTKSSWAGAAARLGSQPVIVDGSSTQVSHGETAEETGAMLGMNAHAMGIRHDLILGEGNRFMRDVKRGIDDYLAATGDARHVPIVNLQCDIDHPTQSMADLLWLQEQFPGGLQGKTIAVSWAYSPSYAKPLSVPQGLITLLSRYGMHVRLAAPPGYDLMGECLAAAKKNAAESGGTFTQMASMDEAMSDADVVYPKSWGPYDLMLERVEANRERDTSRLKAIESRALERNREYTDWIYDERRMGLTRGGKALYMHCLPADIGAEVTPGIMEMFKVQVAREANKKLYAMMALISAAKAPELKATLLAALR